MTEDETIQAISQLPGVVAMTASEESGAPEIAWGDTFFFYDPDDDADSRRFPFATIVIKNYPGFDEDSDLDRPGVYRLNLSVGREQFKELFGFAPAAFAEHRDEFDFTALDTVIPHPAYGTQAWISVLVPGPGTRERLERLISVAHERAKRRHP